VNGRRARKGTVVYAGDIVTVRPLGKPPAPSAMPPLTVVYVDDELLAIDKPPGMPTTIGATAGPSVAAALVAAHPEMATIGDARHSGLVHRLDTGTSGLLLAARRPETYARLRAAFRRKTIVKDYLAVVAGTVRQPDVVDAPLARRPGRRGRMMVARGGTAKAWAAETEIRPIRGDADYTLVRLRMRTGVTHQLRVHLAAFGHPIVGDRRYEPRAERVSTPGAAVPWHYLHAWRIGSDAGDLPRQIATEFPPHWRRFFEARGWPAALAD
jgi:23S rRNA pseudouridine1911/1915/1917 synthase